MAYAGFPRSLVSTLRSATGASVQARGAEERILKGELVSEQGERIEVKDGIVMLSQPSNSRGKAEQVARDDEANRYDRKLAARHYREIVPLVRTLNLSRDARVIEYACGTGRLTRNMLSRAACVLAADFSLESLKELARHVSPADEVGLVCADVTTMRVNRHFTHAVAAQFFEHLESTEEQNSFFTGVAEALVPGGVCVATVYHQDARRVHAQLPEEGHHKNGVYFHYYTSEKLHDAWSPHFTIESIDVIDVMPPGVARFVHSEYLRGIISAVAARTPLSRYGHLLCIVARPKE